MDVEEVEDNEEEEIPVDVMTENQPQSANEDVEPEQQDEQKRPPVHHVSDYSIKLII